jgi:hypothetical protein
VVDAGLRVKYTICRSRDHRIYNVQNRADGDGQRWEYREDRGELLRPVRRGNLLLVEGVAAKEGVLEYRRADGSVRRELVRADTLKRAAMSLARAPVTLLHPDPQQHPQGVTEDNYGELGVGDVDGEILIGDGGFTRVKMALRRRDAITAVESGDARELSCGYRVRLDETPGEHPTYGRYDAEQIERTNNHLAVVPVARAGHEARVRVDGAVATTVISAGPSPAPNPSGAKPHGATVNSKFLRLLTLLGVTSQVNSDDAAIDAACSALDARRDAADKADRDHQAALAAEKTRADSEKARADVAEAEVTRLRVEARTRADGDERTKLQPLCEQYRIDATQHAELPKLKRAIIRASRPTDIPTGWTEAHIDAALELLQQSRQDGSGREAGNRAFAPPPRQEGGNSGTRTDGVPKRRPTANEAHAARLAEARKNGGAA